MNVSSATFNHSALSVLENKTRAESNSQDSTFIEVYNNVQKRSLKQDNNNDILKEISNKYDVRNATFDEIREVSKKLHDAGLISDMEHGFLVFDWNRAADYIRQTVKGYVKSDLNLTPANSEGRRDWVAEFGARKDRDFKLNNLLGYETNNNIYTILKKLDRQ